MHLDLDLCNSCDAIDVFGFGEFIFVLMHGANACNVSVFGEFVFVFICIECICI